MVRFQVSKAGYFYENGMIFFSHLPYFGHIISTMAIHFSSSITLVNLQVIFNTFDNSLKLLTFFDCHICNISLSICMYC